MSTRLRMTGRQHAALINHLFPGDGLEAVSWQVPGVERFMTLPLDPTEGTCHDAAT